MPSSWPLFTTRGPLTKADVLLDTTCFSTAEFDHFDVDIDTDTDTDTDSSSLSLLFADPTDMPIKRIYEENFTEISRRKGLSDVSLGVQARYNHPSLPSSSFLTTLTQQGRFSEYISNEFPSFNGSLPPVLTTGNEPLRKEVNATIANTLLNAAVPTTFATTEWIQKALFNDECLPVPFDEECLDSVQECWDKSRQKFSHFPENMMEHAVQDWLNHLAHTIGVKHGLIRKVEIKEGEPEEFTSADDKDISYIQDTASDQSDGIEEGDNQVILDNSVEANGFVAEGAQDRSFTMVSHNKGPSGGYRLRKPDLILVNRNLRHFLKERNLRPRWHHVEAIVEVSSSAPRESMLQQILEKAALMFEAQPFRRFAIGIAFRYTGSSKKDVEFCFVLVDRAGVCLTGWINVAGYDAVNLARIIFALSYASPAVLGVDTSMTTDIVSGDVTNIKVNDQDFKVVKHIYSSLILFGRGTHVFIVQDKVGKFHILKDAWLLTGHGISEIEVLSSINCALEDNSSEDIQKYRSTHPRFIVGEEIGDSTSKRRGRLEKKPSERLHRRVVTGPVGDPLTSFRSREEFVRVLLDCVNWLEFLHTKCGIVHGDLSINNIVIHRAPPAHPPPGIAKKSKKGDKRKAPIPDTSTQVTWGAIQDAQAPFTLAPVEGLTETMPVIGIVIDYDYARKIDTIMEKTSGTLPFMPLASLDKDKRGKYVHSPPEDLESLLHTILGVVTFTAGPCGQLRAPTDHVPLARWYNEIDREQLLKDKAIDLINYNREIDRYLPEYWKPFSPYIFRLIKATWPSSELFSPSAATHKAFREILQDALNDFTTGIREIPCNYARVTRKHVRSFGEEGRYPYKIYQGNNANLQRLPRPAAIKHLSQWKDSVDA